MSEHGMDADFFLEATRLSETDIPALKNEEYLYNFTYNCQKLWEAFAEHRALFIGCVMNTIFQSCPEESMELFDERGSKEDFEQGAAAITIAFNAFLKNKLNEVKEAEQDDQ